MRLGGAVQRPAHLSPGDREAGPPRHGLGGSQQSQLLTLRSSSRSRAELLVSPGPLEGMAGSWAAGGRLGLRGAGGRLGFGEGMIAVFVAES